MIATKCMSFKRGGFVPPSNAYIETDGVASYMDLGFKPTDNLEFDISFKSIGEYKSTNTYIMSAAISERSSRFNLSWNTSQQLQITAPQTILSEQYSNERFSVSYKNSSVYVNGSYVASVILTGTNSRNMFLSTRGNSSETYQQGCHARYYSAKFWESGVLIRDLVPYSGPRGVGLLDKVNDVLYTNASTSGTLTYGEE